MEQRDDAALARRLCYSIESGNDAERKRPRLLRQLADEGVAEDRRTRELLPAGRPICYDGTAYRLDYEITEETPATTFSVKLDIVTGETPAGRTVQYADLPAADRDVFRREGFADGISGIGTTLLYTREQIEGSALVPDSDVGIIEWANGERAEWHVDEGYETTLNTYRYTVESSRVARRRSSAVNSANDRRGRCRDSPRPNARSSRPPSRRRATSFPRTRSFPTPCGRWLTASAPGDRRTVPRRHPDST